MAAGESSRLGEPKQLVTLAGKTLLERAIDAAQEAGCSPVVVVAGAHPLAGCDREFKIVPNEQWQRGLGTSIRAGVAAVLRMERDALSPPRDHGGSRSIARGEIDAIILMTCDQPLVSAASLRTLIDSESEMAAAEYSGTLGVPALFTAAHFGKLLALADDAGAKKIILAQGAKVAKVPMPEAAIDIDTPAQLATARIKYDGLR